MILSCEHHTGMGLCRDWARGPSAGQVAVAVTFDEKRCLWTGDNLAFFKQAGDAREHVDAILRRQGML